MAEAANLKIRGAFATKIISFWEAIKTENTLEYAVWLGCKGFAGGTVFSVMVFLFLILAFRISLGPATWAGSVLSIFLCFGLAFSAIIRCYVLMLLPQLFSKRGRQALTAYAFLLAISGPACNCLHNVGVLSDSLACGQDQVKRAMRQISEMVRAPLRAVKETFQTLIADVRRIVEPVKQVVVRFARVVASVLGVIENVTKWLGNVATICNREIGSPFQRCLRVFNDAVADCRVKLGIMKFLCEIVTWVQPLCGVAKAVDALCLFGDLVSDAIFGRAKRKLAEFRQHMIDMFGVTIEIEHSLDVDSTASRSLESVVSSVVNEVEERMKKAKDMLSFSVALPSAAFLLLFIKLLLYRHKFQTSDSFDNKYINRRIVHLDNQRLRSGKTETVLPLELKEKDLYTTVTSVRLIQGERVSLVKAFILLTLTTVQISCYLLCDHGLFWTLTLIRKQGQTQLISGEMPSLGVNVEGQGALPDLYRRLVDAFHPPPVNLDLDPTPCLPDPMPPDYRSYVQIGVLLALCWVLALTEPYGLRMRHVVMSYYYPDRAQERAVWLHNHILRSRGAFIQLARRQIQKRLENDGENEHTLWQRILHRNALLLKIFGGTISACTSCATPGTPGKDLAPCMSTGCGGLFCPACLQSCRICPLCEENIDNEFIDFSEEWDSSENEPSEVSDEEDGLYESTDYIRYGESESSSTAYEREADIPGWV